MKALVTGAKGFLGKNLAVSLAQLTNTETYLYDLDTDAALLNAYAGECGFVFHLAGVNRPQRTEEFKEGNRDFTLHLLDALGRRQSRAPVLFASSIQAAAGSPYGQSKKAAEDAVFAYGQEQGVPVYVYRLPNVFGKWCRPNYNSVVATFCHNIARGLPIAVNDPGAKMQLVYVDDVVAEFLRAMEGKPNQSGPYCSVEPVYQATVGTVAEWIGSFQSSRESNTIPDLGDPFAKALYATYLSYLPEDGFIRPLKMNAGHRGSFTELFHTADRGQFSVNVSKPGIVKGNHWHHTKHETFIVVSGRGVIRLRKVGETQVLSHLVSGDKLEAVDIPPGYTHSIENLGSADMVTVIWASENFDPSRPDTYLLEV